ncbi:hypothetical protein B0I32_106265 [Nonomuraea fuscirosea]|uniref:Uncharacterized protein n=1 Tax=Nonomuraea fuscirosea TaxID=1291556 RepID=A0A2T0N2H1_9ACTN|nr:hypothetical protein [Nonomuraea fuscirosea]PRX66129.1 hypothetical protein B0I32_106265 [Nonomuraea fuscirosea]
MSATLIRWSVAATINDSDHLPEDTSVDEVTVEIEEVLADALDAWYKRRGHQLLACEPVVA